MLEVSAWNPGGGGHKARHEVVELRVCSEESKLRALKPSEAGSTPTVASRREEWKGWRKDMRFYRISREKTRRENHAPTLIASEEPVAHHVSHSSLLLEPQPRFFQAIMKQFMSRNALELPRLRCTLTSVAQDQHTMKKREV
ncbi:hypothetical protein NFI96_020214 [Prochilodus magdalenae]|nr:hypothetical protein NFI96_020214 [Prochilodus magdalenae]